MTEPITTPVTEPASPAEPATVVPPAEPTPVTTVTPSAEPAPAIPPQQVAPPPESTPPAEPPPEPPTERVVPAADGYTLPEGVPPELGAWANEKGFTQEQLDSTIEHFSGYVAATDQAQKTALQEMGAAHLKNWGENADHNLTLAKRALQQNDPDGHLASALNESGYGNHPAVLNFLFTLGKGMQEGGFLKSAVNKPPGKKTAAQSMYGANHPSN